MDEVLNFLGSLDLIQRAENFDGASYGCPSYIIPKSNGKTRLIVDYSYLNAAIKCPVQVVPQIESSLNRLNNFAYVSSLDLAQAFYSVKLSDDSRHLTNFVTKAGVFQYKTLPTGMLSSPTLFVNRLELCLNNVPEKDKDGNVIWVDK